MADHWKTGRHDMQSYDGLTGEPFTNIYHATATDGVHKPTGEPLLKVIGRAVESDNKRVASLFAAAPDLLAACEAIQVVLSKYGGQISDLFGHDDQFNDAVDAVDAVIDKAKGR